MPMDEYEIKSVIIMPDVIPPVGPPVISSSRIFETVSHVVPVGLRTLLLSIIIGNDEGVATSTALAVTVCKIALVVTAVPGVVSVNVR